MLYNINNTRTYRLIGLQIFWWIFKVRPKIAGYLRKNVKGDSVHTTDLGVSVLSVVHFFSFYILTQGK